RDAVVMERPEILDQAILVLPAPFAGQKRHDRDAAFKKFRTVTPTAVFRVGQRDALGIARVPGIFGHAGLLGGGLFGERRKWRTGHGGPPCGWAGNVTPSNHESMARCLST